MLEQAVQWLVDVIHALGYWGVFIMAALESTFLPLPSELTLIPAGHLIHTGAWNGPIVFFLAVAGTLVGSLANYFIARTCGRYILVRYGKFFFMNEEKLAHMDAFFAKHGPTSIFLGRLVFGVRHFISFPAGLARMDLVKFSVYTAAGGAIWTLVLLGLGYAISDNKDQVMRLLPLIKVGFLIGVGLIALAYWKRHKRVTPPAE